MFCDCDNNEGITIDDGCFSELPTGTIERGLKKNENSQEDRQRREEKERVPRSNKIDGYRLPDEFLYLINKEVAYLLC